MSFLEQRLAKQQRIKELHEIINSDIPIYEKAEFMDELYSLEERVHEENELLKSEANDENEDGCIFCSG